MGDGWGTPYPGGHPQGRGIGRACNKYSTPRLGRSRVRPGATDPGRCECCTVQPVTRSNRYRPRHCDLPWSGRIGRGAGY